MPSDVFIAPDPQDIATLKRVASELRTRALQHRVVLMDGTAQEAIDLPAALVRVLQEAARQLAEGRSVAIFHDDEELTTQQAADLLHVSRPFLIKLLEAGQIPYHQVGSHRRIRLRDLLAYKRNRDRLRQDHLREMVRVSESLGLYASDDFGDREP